jgi:hypothetical protein
MFREALVQSQVRFNRVLEKVPEKVWEALEQAEVFPALGFAARFRNICQNKTLWLLGIPPKLIYIIIRTLSLRTLKQQKTRRLTFID